MMQFVTKTTAIRMCIKKLETYFKWSFDVNTLRGQTHMHTKAIVQAGICLF